MKRAGSSFGHVDIDYRLRQIFDRSFAEFIKADAECARLDAAHHANENDQEIWRTMFAEGYRYREFGVLVLLTAGAYIEEIINRYAVTFLDVGEYDKRLARKGPVERWTQLPSLCQNKTIRENNPAIAALRELVAARNAVVHPRRHVMGVDPLTAMERGNAEGELFNRACHNATATIVALIAILEAPPAVTL